MVGVLGMHGYEANLAMHDCDVMINIGARFDDRITGALDKFSPDSKKILSILIRPASTKMLLSMCRLSVMWRMCWKTCCGFINRAPSRLTKALSSWWKEIELARPQLPGLSQRR